jgi:hypothetical protein
MASRSIFTACLLQFFVIVKLVLGHEKLCVVHAACYTSHQPIANRYYCNMLVNVQQGGLTKIHVVRRSSVVKITPTTLYESSSGKFPFPGSKLLSRNFRRGIFVSLLPLLPRSGAEQLGQERGGVGFGVKAT